ERVFALGLIAHIRAWYKVIMYIQPIGIYLFIIDLHATEAVQLVEPVIRKILQIGVIGIPLAVKEVPCNWRCPEAPGMVLYRDLPFQFHFSRQRLVQLGAIVF